MTAINEATARQLASFIERAERLETEKAAISEDIKQVFLEAKACGFDVPALKRIMKLRRADGAKLQEAEAIHETYLSALGVLYGTPLGEWAREHAGMESKARLTGTMATTDMTVSVVARAIGLGDGEDAAPSGRHRTGTRLQAEVEAAE